MGRYNVKVDKRRAPFVCHTCRSIIDAAIIIDIRWSKTIFITFNECKVQVYIVVCSTKQITHHMQRNLLWYNIRWHQIGQGNGDTKGRKIKVHIISNEECVTFKSTYFTLLVGISDFFAIPRNGDWKFSQIFKGFSRLFAYWKKLLLYQ